MPNFLYDSVANFILMKKFTLVTSWFFNLRSYKRIISFKKWLSKRYRSKIFFDHGKLKRLKNILFKADLNKFLWFGTQFFSAKNYGLAETGGYLKIYYPLTLQTLVPFTSFYFLDHRRFFKNRLALSAVFFNWSFGIARAINLHTALTAKKYVLPFVAKNFFKDQFIKNKFFIILWRNRFHKRRKFWYGRLNYRFFGTNFSKKYLKLLFYQRYLNWMVITDLIKLYPYSRQEQLNSFYIQVIASQFVPRYSKLHISGSLMLF